jgi:hypothetical protein
MIPAKSSGTLLPVFIDPNYYDISGLSDGETDMDSDTGEAAH